MRAKLIFNLKDPDDKEKFEEIISNNSANLQCAIHKFSQEILRKYRKYGIPYEDVFKESNHQITDDEKELAELLIDHIEQRFYQILEEYEAKIT